MAITLQLLKDEDINLLENYDLTEEQLRFTATPMGAIEKAKLEPDRYPVVILYHNEIAGFFALHTDEGPKPFTRNPHAILLRSYSIRNSFQGRRIAQQSMELLRSFVATHFPDKNEIVLAVNHQNTAAQHVYKKAGFQDTGRRVMGRSGEQYIYELLM